VIVVQILQFLAFIASVVCWIMVLIKMFQNGLTGLGIASIVLTVCCGFGWLITYVYGWMKVREWNISNIMLIWTGCIVADVILGGIGIAVGGLPTSFQQQLHH